jgi:hypothetical protein
MLFSVQGKPGEKDERKCINCGQKFEGFASFVIHVKQSEECKQALRAAKLARKKG